MLASRAMKPKLSLNINTNAAAPLSTSAAAASTGRPQLSLAPLGLRSPVTPQAMSPLLRSPVTPTAMTPRFAAMTTMSPLPMSPTARNTKLNARGFSTMSVSDEPTYAYINNASSRSILKRSQSNTSKRRVAQLSFNEDPMVYAISPIEDPEYYGGYKKMSREERRWSVKT